MTNDNSSSDSDRREFARLKPNPSAREVTIVLSSGRQVRGLIEDISRGGLGFVTASGQEIEADAEVTIQYHDLCLQGHVANLTRTANGFVRAGVAWSHPIDTAPATIQTSENHECPRIIVVKDADDGNLYLQQASDDGTEEILISAEQLEQIVGYLACLDIKSSSEMSLNGPEDSSVRIRVFSSDRSFSISQGTKYIWGSGDIRGLLSSESDTHPIS